MSAFRKPATHQPIGQARRTTGTVVKRAGSYKKIARAMKSGAVKELTKRSREIEPAD